MSDLDELRSAYADCHAAALELGLDPGDVDFHVVPAHHLYEVASYGLPGHFRHWSYGRDFWRQKASYDRGRGRIYELVINAAPAEAYLLETNSLLENITVIAHVLGHAHFFRHNAYFSHTDRHMPETARLHAERIRDYELEHGQRVVEAFIDHAMVLQHHVDRNLRLVAEVRPMLPPEPRDGRFDDLLGVEAIPTVEAWRALKKRSPQHPDGNILAFIAEAGDLDDWQRDILRILHHEALYFLPQRLTKVANEGLASWAHTRIMRMIDSDVDPGGFEFAHMHSGVVASHPGQLNPYRLGLAVLERIEARWDEPTDDDRAKLGMRGGDGRARLLEAVAVESDESLLRNYLDRVVIEDLDLFSFGYEKPKRAWVAHHTAQEDWEAVRDAVADSFAGGHLPLIKVVDSDWAGRGELLLRHDGRRKLDKDWAGRSLRSVRALWGRPVSIAVKVDGDWRRWGIDEPSGDLDDEAVDGDIVRAYT